MIGNFSIFKKKRLKLEAKMEKLQEQLKELQDSCPHGNLAYRYRGDSGNWDKSDDHYWMEWRCSDCRKTWTTSQDNSYHLTTVVYPQATKM